MTSRTRARAGTPGRTSGKAAPNRPVDRPAGRVAAPSSGEDRRLLLDLGEAWGVPCDPEQASRLLAYADLHFTYTFLTLAAHTAIGRQQPDVEHMAGVSGRNRRRTSRHRVA